MTTPDHPANPVASRHRILIITDAYLPGWRAGGPIRSIANLVDQLGDAFEISILTRNHDHADDEPYVGVTPDNWTRVGEARVYYADDTNLGLGTIRQVLKSADPDLVYVNSVMSRLTVRYLVVRRFRRSSPAALLAPRGEFSGGALGIKSWRKRAYLTAAHAVGLFQGVRWHASSPHEAQDIEERLGPKVDIRIVANPAARPPEQPVPAPDKESGSATFVAVARVSRMKNLPFLIAAISQLHGDVVLRLVGGRDNTYWPELEEQLKALPANVSASWAGAQPPTQAEQELLHGHFFVLPTLGENFGHAIYEALRAGRPVVISDRTPWKDLPDAGAGWDVPLEDIDRWIQVLQRCVDMSQVDYVRMSEAAHEFASRWFTAADLAGNYSRLFEETIRS